MKFYTLNIDLYIISPEWIMLLFVQWLGYKIDRAIIINKARYKNYA